MAKAPNENGSDGEERKLGEQTGLDTRNFRVTRISVPASKFANKNYIYLFGKKS